MLLRLPFHVRDMVKEHVSAMWGVDLLFITDTSPEGRDEAEKEAAERGGEVRILPLQNAAIVVKKKPP